MERAPLSPVADPPGSPPQRTKVFDHTAIKRGQKALGELAGTAAPLGVDLGAYALAAMTTIPGRRWSKQSTVDTPENAQVSDTSLSISSRISGDTDLISEPFPSTL